MTHADRVAHYVDFLIGSEVHVALLNARGLQAGKIDELIASEVARDLRKLAVAQAEEMEHYDATH